MAKTKSSVVIGRERSTGTVGRATQFSLGALGPGDVVVVECDGLMTIAMKAQLVQQLNGVWPDNKVVVCDGGTRLRVVKKKR